MKLGIFSGTFDPVHDGHIQFAKAALATEIDQVVFMPEQSPRNKQVVAGLEDRVKMLELEINSNDSMEVFVDKDNKQHSLKPTLESLRRAYPNATSTSLLIGGDAFESVPKWPDQDKLLAGLTFVVAMRGEDDGESAVRIKQEHELDMILLPSPLPRVSSSDIRSKIARGNNDVALAESVLQYIHERKLYQGQS